MSDERVRSGEKVFRSDQCGPSMEQQPAILCFGCKKRFWDREAFREHMRSADHGDMGEAWVTA